MEPPKDRFSGKAEGPCLYRKVPSGSGADPFPRSSACPPGDEIGAAFHARYPALAQRLCKMPAFPPEASLRLRHPPSPGREGIRAEFSGDAQPRPSVPEKRINQHDGDVQKKVKSAGRAEFMAAKPFIPGHLLSVERPPVRYRGHPLPAFGCRNPGPFQTGQVLG
jgi:hypothetical protein